MIKSPPDNAGDPGSIPDPGVSQMPRSNKAHGPQLSSLCPEPRSCSNRAHRPQQLVPSQPRSRGNKRSHPTLQIERSPYALQLEKSNVDPVRPKIKSQ